MKTKPKLIRVLVPPVSLMMMMQHNNNQDQPHHQSDDNNNDDGSDGISIATQEALYASLAKNRPLSGLTPPASSDHHLPSGYKLHHITLHPCKSLVTYMVTLVDESTLYEGMTSGVGIGGIGIGGIGIGSSQQYDPKSNTNKWIIAQDTKTRHIIFSMTLEDLAIEAAATANTATNASATNTDEIINSVSQLTFHDQSTLYWNGFTTEEGKENKSWSYLMIHCLDRVIILDLSKKQQQKGTVVVADITHKSFVSAATAAATASQQQNAILSSNTVIAISCTQLLVTVIDGSFIIYDWKLGKIMNSMKWTGSVPGFTDNIKTTDWIVQIIPVNPYLYNPSEAMMANNKNNNNPQSKGKSKRRRRRMVMCVTKKGVAYLCDISNITNNSKSNTTTNDTNLLLPLARMEGGSIPPTPEEHSIASMEHIPIRYDPLRDLFCWMFYPSNKNNKSKLFVWDLSTILNEYYSVIAETKNNSGNNAKSSSSKHQRKNNSQTTTLQEPDPVLITQFSYEGISHMIFPGWVHESFPSDSIACLAVTKEGELQVLVAPLYNAGSWTIKNPFPAATVWSVKLSQVMIRDLQLQQDNGQQSHFKVQSVRCSSSIQDTSTLFIGTTIGILTIKLLDGLTGIPSPGTRFVHFNANLGTMGKSILSVQGGSQISYSPLELPPLLSSNNSTDDDDDNNNTNNNDSSSFRLSQINPIGKMEYFYGATTGANTGGGGGGTSGSGSGGGKFFSSLTGSSAATTNRKSIRLTSIVHESPQPLHLPIEVRNKRIVRLPPRFLPSPSGKYVCCLWTEEMRYEILNVSDLLETVTDRKRHHGDKNPVIAGGTGVTSFAWIGDFDVFCLLYDPEQDLALKAGINLGAPEESRRNTDHDVFSADKMIKNLGKMKTYKKGVKNVVGTAGKLKSIEGLRDLGKDTGKFGKGALTGMTKLTGMVAVGVTQGTAQVATATTKMGEVSVGAGKIALKGTKKGARKVTKKMPFGWGKKKDKKGAQGSLASAELDEEEDEAPTIATSPIDIGIEEDPEAEEMAAAELEKKLPWVELRMLVGSATDKDENVGSITVSSLGQLSLRSGNRNPPTILFGGPVLCVGSKFDETDEGLSYFYTKKRGQDEESASIYVSSGPAFPCPDIIAWDDDGKLCALVIKGRVSIYLSEEPNFVMIGTIVIGSSSDVDVISLRFIHGVLYLTTRSSVQCIFLGDLDGEICHLDSYTLASSNVPMLPSKSIVTDYTSLTPPTIPMPLNHPEVLGYQNGSLILSTITGIVAIPLGLPLLRIGALISAGSDYYPKAEMWFDAIPNHDHEALATFLERRGVPGLALNLNGISLETTIDICMRYGFVDRLEEVVDMHGLNGLRAIDMSRGVSSNIFGLEEHGTSIVVCVGAFLLSFGRVELVRRLATECLASSSSDDAGKQEAFLLAGLLLSVDGSDSKRVIYRSVESSDDCSSNWGPFARSVKKYIL